MTEERRLQLIISSPEYKLLVDIRRLVHKKGRNNFDHIIDLVDFRYHEIREEIAKLEPETKP